MTASLYQSGSRSRVRGPVQGSRATSTSRRCAVRPRTRGGGSGGGTLGRGERAGAVRPGGRLRSGGAGAAWRRGDGGGEGPMGGVGGGGRGRPPLRLQPRGLIQVQPLIARREAAD